MSDSGANLLTKITALGLIGVLFSAAMLLYTLKLADPARGEVSGTVLSPLAFETHLNRGDVIECTYAEHRLRGVLRGAGAERIPFRVAGDVPSSLLQRIVINSVPLHTRASRKGPRRP